MKTRQQGDVAKCPYCTCVFYNRRDMERHAKKCHFRKKGN